MKMHLALVPIPPTKLTELKTQPSELEAAEIYLTGLWRGFDFDYLAECYERFQDFYPSIAKRGDSVLVTVL